MVNIQESPPQSSRVAYPNEQKVSRECKEVCMDKEGAPGKTKAEKEAYRGWKQGQMIWKEYRNIV